MLQNPELHYLDNAATTIVAPEVADVIDKAMREHWANPSSLYGPGARSEEALNAARAAVARTLGCKAKELYFTSCGSESNNLALLGAARTRTFGKDIVVSGFEHPSVQRPLEDLAKRGYNVTVVKPRADGTLDINEMLEHVGKNTILVACMMVNNEVGTRNDVERLAALLDHAFVVVIFQQAFEGGGVAVDDDFALEHLFEDPAFRPELVAHVLVEQAMIEASHRRKIASTVLPPGLREAIRHIST